MHFCGTRDKWPLLEQHSLTYFVDDRRDVALAIDDEAEIRRASAALPPGAYTGPTALFMVPTVFEGGRREAAGPYQQLLTQRLGGCLHLRSNLDEAVERICTHAQLNQHWHSGPPGLDL